MKEHTQASVLLALNSIEKELGTEQFKRMFKTTTVDNGSEFSKLGELKCVEDLFYEHPYSSHERGTNKHFNGLMREFLPKEKSFNSLTDEELQRYVSAINNRPRKLLGFLSAKERLDQLKVC